MSHITFNFINGKLKHYENSCNFNKNGVRILPQQNGMFILEFDRLEYDGNALYNHKDETLTLDIDKMPDNYIIIKSELKNHFDYYRYQVSIIDNKEHKFVDIRTINIGGSLIINRNFIVNL